jgi:salicylate synthetase
MLLQKYQKDDYYAYERGELWHVGLGSHASLLIDAKGQTATSYIGGKQESYPVKGSLADIAREFTSEHSKHSGKIFGQVGFNYGAHIRGQAYNPGQWPLLSLMVPGTEVTLHQDYITITGYDHEKVREVCDSINTATSYNPGSPQTIDTRYDADEYITRVTKALDRVDMPATLVLGRRSNTPARTFSLNHAGIQATGFSPELVALVENGKVITEPLAGTRSREGTDAEVERLRQELVNDSKEIVEHVISVKEAIEELQRLCPADTVVVEDLMLVRARGAVQHLGSRVAGYLSPGKDAWNAFDVLSPSVTASGIPKQAALSGIQRLESRPRELYSGSVLMLEGTRFFEATLVLRTVFQDQSRQWLQAGAGVISQSNPQRELTETCEKLSSVASYVVLARDN